MNQQPKWLDAMCDLETAGLPPDGALMSIGVAFFDLNTCTIGPTFYRAVNLATSVRDGGVITPSTMLFWLAQSDEARKAVLYDTYDVRQVLTELAEFIAEHSTVKDVRMWGNSPAFDLTILGGAYRRADMRVPWSPFRERDFRTVRHMYPAIEYDTADKGKGEHNAIEDAKFQIAHLFKIKNRNKKEAANA